MHVHRRAARAEGGQDELPLSLSPSPPSPPRTHAFALSSSQVSPPPPLPLSPPDHLGCALGQLTALSAAARACSDPPPRLPRRRPGPRLASRVGLHRLARSPLTASPRQSVGTAPGRSTRLTQPTGAVNEPPTRSQTRDTNRSTPLAAPPASRPPSPSLACFGSQPKSKDLSGALSFLSVGTLNADWRLAGAVSTAEDARPPRLISPGPCPRVRPRARTEHERIHSSHALTVATTHPRLHARLAESPPSRGPARLAPSLATSSRPRWIALG